MKDRRKPKLAVWKFASCDGCQLSLLDCEDELLALAGAIEIANFPEASREVLPGPYELSLVEGSITTPHDAERIQEVRRQSKYLVTIGACATAGGIQALRNFADVKEFLRIVYARPDYIDTLATSTAISAHVSVDFELHGCPINKRQLLEVITAFLHRRRPNIAPHSVCIECKQRGSTCVMVTRGEVCLGPVTHTGCGALCPAYARGCYGCFGPMESPNAESLGTWLQARGVAGEALLASPPAPILLLHRREMAELVPLVAPGNLNLGVMLPSTPLHHLLLREFGGVLVATSGNRSGEPLCTDETDALARLQGIADVFLVHDRPIVHRADDSILRVMAGREVMLRRARGYAPRPLRLPRAVPEPVLAVGGYLKNTVALAWGDRLVLSPHIGDLDGPEVCAAHHLAAEALCELHGIRPQRVACDAHPDYPSTRMAEVRGLPVMRVPHHAAHVLACMADNGLEPPCLGVAWDGTGYGEEGTLWGGEFLHVTERDCERVASFLPFPLPGGDVAAREPRRSALGVLYAMYGEALFDRSRSRVLDALGFSSKDVLVLRQALTKGINRPMTSSVGRLFDAVAALTGLCQCASFEGEAAMALEFAAEDADSLAGYDFVLLESEGNPLLIDWRPMMRRMLDDMFEKQEVNLSPPNNLVIPEADFPRERSEWPEKRAIRDPGRHGKSLWIPDNKTRSQIKDLDSSNFRDDKCTDIAHRFHATLAEMIRTIAQKTGIEQIVLTGGCFQNRLLLELSIARLKRAGQAPFWHRHIPPGDGGLAVGQVMAAAREMEQDSSKR